MSTKLTCVEIVCVCVLFSSYGRLRYSTMTMMEEGQTLGGGAGLARVVPILHTLGEKYSNMISSTILRPEYATKSLAEMH